MTKSWNCYTQSNDIEQISFMHQKLHTTDRNQFITKCVMDKEDLVIDSSNIELYRKLLGIFCSCLESYQDIDSKIGSIPAGKNLLKIFYMYYTKHASHKERVYMSSLLEKIKSSGRVQENTKTVILRKVMSLTERFCSRATWIQKTEICPF